MSECLSEFPSLERPSLFSQMSTVHNHFMKRTLHVRKSVTDGIVNWEECHCNYIGKKRYSSMSAGLASYPLTGWSKRLLPRVKGAHASSVNTLWWQKLSLWLSQHGFEGVLAEGTFSLANAEQHSGTNVTTAFANLQLQRSVFSWTTCFLTPMSWPLSFVT